MNKKQLGIYAMPFVYGMAGVVLVVGMLFIAGRALSCELIDRVRQWKSV